MSDAEGEVAVAAIEALLFAASEPVSIKDLCVALEHADVAGVRDALEVLGERYSGSDSGVRLHQVGGRWQLRTDPRFANAVQRLVGAKPRRLSRAALEVLAVIAYRQPVTKAEIDEIRGVDSGGVVRKLLSEGIVSVRGRQEDVPGRPLLYATSRAFLELFSLGSLADLPTPEDADELDDSSEPE